MLPETAQGSHLRVTLHGSRARIKFLGKNTKRTDGLPPDTTAQAQRLPRRKSVENPRPAGCRRATRHLRRLDKSGSLSCQCSLGLGATGRRRCGNQPALIELCRPQPEAGSHRAVSQPPSDPGRLEPIAAFFGCDDGDSAPLSTRPAPFNSGKCSELEQLSRSLFHPNVTSGEGVDPKT